jgi:hypothetical protein
MKLSSSKLNRLVRRKFEKHVKKLPVENIQNNIYNENYVWIKSLGNKKEVILKMEGQEIKLLRPLTDALRRE